MMIGAVLTGSVLVALSLLVAAVPARADDLDTCLTGRPAQARLAACSAVIAAKSLPPQQRALALRNRGRLRLEAGALVAALADLDEALVLAPDDLTAYVLRAQTRVGHGDITGAIADYTTVIRLKPGWSTGHTGRGHAYLANGSPALAVADFAEAIRLNPKAASGYNNRALAHRKAGDLGKAIDDLTQAININPIYALAYVNRGYAHEARGAKADAVADFRRALMLDPTLTGAKDGLARLSAMGALAEESRQLVMQGEALVTKHCSGCHAVGRDGTSPNAKAPTFRSLHARHPLLDMREPLTRGLAAPHDEMPKFQLAEADEDKIIAYINSLGGRN
jgi:tetratricopeptide (TPR) repeat protein